MMVYQDSAQLNFPKEKVVSCYADHSQIAKLKRGESGAYPDIKRAIKQALLRVAEEQVNVELSRLQLQPGVKAVGEERSRHNGDYFKGSVPQPSTVPAGKSRLDDAQSQGSPIPEPPGETADFLHDKDVVSTPGPPASDDVEHGSKVQNKQAISDPTKISPSTQVMSRDEEELPEGDIEALKVPIPRATDRWDALSSPTEKQSLENAVSRATEPPSRSELCSASQEGDVEKVRSLLAQGCSIHESSEDLVDYVRDAFLLAARNRRLDVLKLLIQHNCDVSKRTLNGNTALHLISFDPEIKSKPIIESLVILLLDHGVPLEGKNVKGATALLLSAYESKISIAECLLDHGADISSTDNDGFTALHLAVHEGHHEVVALLLSKGADISSSNNDGYTALHWAAKNGHHEAVALLLSKGAPLEARTIKFSYTPIHLLCSAHNGSGKIARLLLEAGIDKEAVSGFKSQRALHMAALKGKLEVLNELLVFGVEIDAPADYDWRALHYAKFWGHWRIIGALLAGGANPCLKNDHGDRPSEVSWSQKATISPEDKEKCLKLLEDAEKAWKEKERWEREKGRQERMEYRGSRFTELFGKSNKTRNAF